MRHDRRARKRLPTNDGPPSILQSAAGDFELDDFAFRQDGLWAVDACNPNSLTTAVSAYYPESAADISIVLETKSAGHTANDDRLNKV